MEEKKCLGRDYSSVNSDENNVYLFRLQQFTTSKQKK